MDKRKTFMKTKFPTALKEAVKKGFVLSIIQFGSSLKSLKYQDVDLGIVIKKGCYKDFLNTVYGSNFQGFDISLIKEEEVRGSKKFRFGKHGAHFLFSLINGKTLYGRNPFKKFKVSIPQIKRSILLSLFIYFEDIRRAIFLGKINKNIKRRWPKFLRLCLYLLNHKLKYPDVLSLDDDKIKEQLRKYKLPSILHSRNFKNPKDWIIAYETIWEKVLKRKKLINNYI